MFVCAVPVSRWCWSEDEGDPPAAVGAKRVRKDVSEAQIVASSPRFVVHVRLV